MNCPKCNKEMIKGNVTLPNNVTFYPGDRKTGFVKDQTWVAGRWNLFGKQTEAYHCEDCKVITFQY